MIIKNSNIQFERFTDGICSIYTETSEGNYSVKYSSVGFTKRTMGIQRHFISDAYHKKVDKVIRIPKIPRLEHYDLLKIDKDLYSIELIQELEDANPPCFQLNLKISERKLNGNV